MPLGDVHSQRNGDEWVFSWPEADDDKHTHKLLITASNPHDRGEDLWIELSVDYLKDDGTCRRLHGPKRHNLLATSSDAALAKYLVTRMHNEVALLSWQAMLNDISSVVAEQYRRGEPFLDLSAEPNVGPVKYLFEKFIPLDETTAIAAEGGAAKGMVALGLSIACTTGMSIADGELKSARQALATFAASFMPEEPTDESEKEEN